MTQGTRISAELRRAWNGAPWHGPSVAELAGRLKAKQAASRRARGSHTPWQLVLHLTVWVETPVRRLDDASYDPVDAEDFPEAPVPTEEHWKRDVARLGDAIERLAQRVAQLSDDVLDAPVGGRGHTYLTMLDGVAQHLAYHGGQIAVLALDEEVAGVIMPPPLIGIGALMMAEALQRVYAAPFRMGAKSAGYVLIAMGLGLVYWAHEYFVKHKTPAAPWRAARALVSGGPFALTRNPMYVGMLLVLAGAGLARHNAWYVVMLVPAWAVLQWGVVLREERYLLKKFGAPYQHFMDRTRRWLV